MLGQIKRMRTSLERAYELFFNLFFFVGKKDGLLKGQKEKPNNASFIYLPCF